MRYTWIPFLMFLLSGCATRDSVDVYIPTPSQALVRAASEPTKFVETRYELRSYREAANPAIRHEPHGVYRRTRLPVTISTDFAIGSRTNHPPASFAPLAESDELAAELGTQKNITADLRAMQTSMRDTEQRMQAQYATLVRQSAEVAIAKECSALSARGLDIQADRTVSDVVIQRGYHERLGARPMRDATELLIRNAVARELLHGRRGIGRLRSARDGDQLQLDSTAA